MSAVLVSGVCGTLSNLLTLNFDFGSKLRTSFFVFIFFKSFMNTYMIKEPGALVRNVGS